MKMFDDEFANDIDEPYFNVETREVPGTEGAGNAFNIVRVVKVNVYDDREEEIPGMEDLSTPYFSYEEIRESVSKDLDVSIEAIRINHR